MAKRRSSKHAEKRMQQRGIDEAQLRLIEVFGAYEYQKGGEYSAYLPRKLIRKLRKAIDNLENVRAIVSEDGCIVTVMHETHRAKTTNYTA